MVLREDTRADPTPEEPKVMERRPLGTAAQVSRYLGVPIGTLHVWRSKGKGPRAIRIGRHLRWDWAEIDAWVETQAVGGAV